MSDGTRPEPTNTVDTLPLLSKPDTPSCAVLTSTSGWAALTRLMVASSASLSR